MPDLLYSIAIFELMTRMISTLAYPGPAAETSLASDVVSCKIESKEKQSKMPSL